MEFGQHRGGLREQLVGNTLTGPISSGRLLQKTIIGAPPNEQKQSCAEKVDEGKEDC